MNSTPCRRHAFDAGRCVLCNEPEHRGPDHKGVIRDCIQEGA